MSSESHHVRVNNLYSQVIQGEDLVHCYDEWAPKYDEDCKKIKQAPYIRPFQAAEFYFRNAQDVRILDVGAGTGYAGEELTKRGFKNIEAVEPSKQMLNVAKNKKIYKRLIQILVGQEPLPYNDDTFDCVIAIGVIGPSHLKTDSIPELYRIMKKGGLLMIQGNYNYWRKISEYHVNMKNFLDTMVSEKKFALIEWNILDNYVDFGDGGVPGLFFVYKKL